MKKIILMGAILALIAGVGFATYEYYRPTASTADLKADVSISATEIYSAFENDETMANATYAGKTVAVNGVVIDVKPNDESPTIILETTSAMGGVLCTFYASESAKIASVKQGDTVTIKGKCTGFLMDVVLNECVIQ